MKLEKKKAILKRNVIVIKFLKKQTGLLQEINKNNKNFQTYYLSLHITEPGKDVQTHHKVSKMKEIIKIITEKIKRNRD